MKTRTTIPPHPLSVVFKAMLQHAGYGQSTRRESDHVCDKACCRFVQLMGDEEPPSGDVRPGREARRKRTRRHYDKRIA